MEKTTEKLILEKLLHIESDIKELKTEMHERFNAVENKVGSIAGTYETYEKLLGKNMIEVEKIKSALKQ